MAGVAVSGADIYKQRTSCKITAIPGLLQLLKLNKCDATGYRTSIADTTVRQGDNDLLSIWDNQKSHCAEKRQHGHVKRHGGIIFREYDVRSADTLV